MPIVGRAHGKFQFILTPNLRDYFRRHRIRSSHDESEPRWKLWNILTANETQDFNPHIVCMSGDSVSNFGSFSYSFSALGPYIAVGRYCSISWNVRNMGPQNATHFVSSTEMLYRQDTMFRDSLADFGATDWTFYPNLPGGAPKIGNDVWIGQDVILGPKTVLGDGCVVAAGAVVTGVVPPYAIVGGVPAKIIRYRFDPDLIEELLALQWWDYALPELRGLPLDDPRKFIPAMRQWIEAGRVKPYRPDLGRALDVIEALG